MITCKEKASKLSAIKRDAMPHKKAVALAIKKAARILGDDELAFEYIENNTELRHVMRMAKLYKEGRLKDAGEELRRYHKL